MHDTVPVGERSKNMCYRNLANYELYNRRLQDCDRLLLRAMGLLLPCRRNTVEF